MSNGFMVEFTEQLKEEIKLNKLIKENLGKVKIDG